MNNVRMSRWILLLWSFSSLLGMESYKGAGVLPYYIENDNTYVLLGKESIFERNVGRKINAWREFGGKKEQRDNNPMQTAARAGSYTLQNALTRDQLYNQLQYVSPIVFKDYYLYLINTGKFKHGRDLYQYHRGPKSDFYWMPLADLLIALQQTSAQDSTVSFLKWPKNSSEKIYGFLRATLQSNAGQAALNSIMQQAGEKAPLTKPTVIPVVTQGLESAPRWAADASKQPWTHYNRSAQSWKANFPQGVIYFYKPQQGNFEFTNFYNAPINIDGVTWPTNEHYFQAMKFPGNKGQQQKILNAPTADLALQYGREKVPGFDAQWEQHKYGIMLKAVRAKFNQHPQLKNQLLATGNKVLVEDTAQKTNPPKDKEWGAGQDYTGKNWLGIILMQVRDELHTPAKKMFPFKKKQPFMPKAPDLLSLTLEQLMNALNYLSYSLE